MSIHEVIQALPKGYQTLWWAGTTPTSPAERSSALPSPGVFLERTRPLSFWTGNRLRRRERGQDPGRLCKSWRGTRPTLMIAHRLKTRAGGSAPGHGAGAAGGRTPALRKNHWFLCDLSKLVEANQRRDAGYQEKGVVRA